MNNKKRFVAIMLCAVVLVCSLFALAACKKEMHDLIFTVDGEQHSIISSAGNETIVLPAQPVIAGYDFKGWYFDENAWQNEFTADYFADTAVERNYRIYARMELATYTVTFGNTQGTQIANVTYNILSNPITLPTPSYGGHNFDGWYNGETRVTSIPRGSTGSMDLLARWSLATYTITYENTHGAIVPNPTSYTMETDTFALDDISADHYTFNGWFDENNTLVLQINRGSFGDKTLTARWTATSYNITYVNDLEEEGDAKNTNRTHFTIETDTFVLQDLTKEGYTFLGWFDENDVLVTSVAKGSFGPKTFKAKWSEFTINETANNTCEITGYSLENAVVVIPETIKGRTVTAIATDAFRGNKTITQVTLNAGLEAIGDHAFHGCTSLASINFTAKVKSLGDGAFQGCTALTSVNIPVNITSLGVGAFQDCTALSSVTLTNGSTKIADQAFMDCRTIASINIPVGVEEIGASAFNNCTSLADIVLPTGLKKIGDNAFLGCMNLMRIDLPTSLEEIGNNAFNGCFKLVEVYNLSSLELTIGSLTHGQVAYYAGRIYKDSTSPSILTKTADGFLFVKNETDVVLFGYDGTATSLTLPASFEGATYSIGDYAFASCRNIISINIPNGISEIGTNAFAYCVALKTIRVPASLKTVGKDAFVGAAITDVYFGGTVAEWCTISFVSSTANPLSSAANLFISDTKLTALTIPSNIVAIPAYAFYGCISVESLTFPKEVKTFGSNAFYNCTNLARVNYNSGILDWSAIAFEDGGANPLGNADGLYINGVLYKDFVAVAGMTTVSAYAFWGYGGLETVDLTGLESTQKGAFGNCSALTTLTMSNSLIKIGENSFTRCRALESVRFGNGLIGIGTGAFRSCTSLIQFSLPSSLGLIQPNAFAGCTNLVRVQFAESNGWYRLVATAVAKPSASNGAAFTTTTSAPLANATTSATYLRSTYVNYTWFRRDTFAQWSELF